MSTKDVQQQLSEALQRLSTQHEKQLQEVYNEVNLLRAKVESLEDIGTEHQNIVGGQQSGYKTLPQEPRLKFELAERQAKQGKESEPVYLCDLCKHCMIRQGKVDSELSYRCLIDGEEVSTRYFDCNQFEYYKN